MTYMDGKSGAEELVGKLLHDPALLQTLAHDEERRKDACPNSVSYERRTVMADPKPQQDSAAATIGAVETDEFDSLLQKEFKPKTDEAKEAVERAVHTLAEQALSQTRS